jgi:2-dehydropantoate 2-reductase
VTGIARGRQLAAIRENGHSLIEDGQRRTSRIKCVETPTEAGPQDVVFMTMKSHSAPAVAETIAPLLVANAAYNPVSVHAWLTEWR